MRRATAVLLLLAAPAAAGADWQLFARGASAEVYFDRDAVRATEGYVQFRMRIDYGEPRTARERARTYRRAVSTLAADCAARTVAVVATERYDAAGGLLAERRREPGRWQDALAPVGADGLQARLLAHACALARGETPAPPAARPAPRTRVGAGVVAAVDGLVLTNHHLVKDCESISVRDAGDARAAARVVAADVAQDLALLKAEHAFAAAASFRRGAPLQAGEAVTVVGFPLAALLGFEPNVAFGYVSAVGGLRGDATRFQISAPIHKGNSGGPILDQGGQVIGVVTSKLDALAVQRRMGDLPQNISFGVKGEVALAFLEAHAAAYRSAPAGARLENTEVAAIGRAVTVLVTCRGAAPGTPG